jgi:predicted permease
MGPAQWRHRASHAPGVNGGFNMFHLFKRRRLRDEDIEEELNYHLEMLAKDSAKEGEGPAEARLAARRRLGNWSLIKEATREIWTWTSLERFGQDLRYAWRMMLRSPGFTAISVLTLGLGIGANSAIFSVVRAVVLKPLGYRDPDALVQLSMENSRNLGTFTPVRYRQLKGLARSFSDLGAFGLPQNMMLTTTLRSEQVTAARVSANGMRLLGVRPLLGRDFRDEEDTPGSNPVAMISAELWDSRFRSDPNAIGTSLVLDSQPYTIIGVAPRRFEFPFTGVDVWLTRPGEWSGAPPQAWDRTASLTGFARLKLSVTLQQAAAELAVLNDQYVASNRALPDAKTGSTMRVERLADAVVTPVRRMLWILFGAVGFVLLIACANLASLMLARATSRSREFAIRSALGAGRNRLIMQTLVESMLLAMVGAALGLGLALTALVGITQQHAVPLPRVGEIRLDAYVLSFTLVVTVLTGLFVGILPSLWLSEPILTQRLREHGVMVSQHRRILNKISGHGLLVVAQIGLSFVLLIGAGLLIKSFIRLRDVNLGFRPKNILTMRITLPPTRYNNGQKITGFLDELIQRIQSIPGVQYAAVARSLPTSGYQLVALQPSEQAQIPFTERPLGAMQTISGNYFRLFGISLRAGRWFTEHDLKGVRPVLIINETLARRFWPNYTRAQAPIGQHLQLGNSTVPVEIVGIVGDVHEGGPAFAIAPEVYLPARLSPPQTAYLLIRGANDPLPMLNVVRAQLSALDRDQTVASIKSMSELIDSALGQQKVTMMLLGLFAILALLLAAIGLYGVIAYAMAQRVAEIGIRRALGAQERDILTLILSQGLTLSLIGAVLGLSGALALTRFLRTFLFEISSTDPGIFAAITLLLLLVTLAASYLPARRATRIDPMAALR